MTEMYFPRDQKNMIEALMKLIKLMKARGYTNKEFLRIVKRSWRYYETEYEETKNDEPSKTS